jgi:hypothetical protein
MPLRRLTYWLLLPLLSLLLTSRSCEESAEETAVREKQEFHQKTTAIEKGMASDHLNKKALIAFEEKAKQKLVDFYEYLNIINDTSIDIGMRESVYLAQLGLFSDLDKKVLVPVNRNGKLETIAVNDIWAFSKNLPADVSNIHIATIRSSGLPEMTNDLYYSGDLVFSYSFSENQKAIKPEEKINVYKCTIPYCKN